MRSGPWEVDGTGSSMVAGVEQRSSATQRSLVVTTGADADAMPVPMSLQVGTRRQYPVGCFYDPSVDLTTDAIANRGIERELVPDLQA